MKKKNGFIKGFAYAVKGISLTLKERNMRIHFAVAFYVLIFAVLGKVEEHYYPVLFICIGLVIGTEALNTAIERLCDRVSGEYDRMLGGVKDISAGAVLVFAIFSAAAGIVVFARQTVIEQVVNNIANNIWLVIPLALSLGFFIIFIKGKKQ